MTDPQPRRPDRLLRGCLSRCCGARVVLRSVSYSAGTRIDVCRNCDKPCQVVAATDEKVAHA